MPLARFPPLPSPRLPPLRLPPFQAILSTLLAILSNHAPWPITRVRRHPVDPPAPPAAHAAPVQPLTPVPVHPAPKPGRPSTGHRTAQTCPQNAPKLAPAGPGTPLGVPGPAGARSPKNRPIRPSTPPSQPHRRTPIPVTPRPAPRLLPALSHGPRLVPLPRPVPSVFRPTPHPHGPSLHDTQRTPKTSQKSTPPHLKSFLEKTLTRTKAPHSHRPNSQSLCPLDLPHIPPVGPRLRIHLFLPRPVGEGRGEQLCGPSSVRSRSDPRWSAFGRGRCRGRAACACRRRGPPWAACRRRRGAGSRSAGGD